MLGLADNGAGVVLTLWILGTFGEDTSGVETQAPISSWFPGDDAGMITKTGQDPGAGIYAAIINDISVLTVMLGAGKSGTVTISCITAEVHAWIKGAIGINSNSTFAGASILDPGLPQLSRMAGPRL